MSTAAHDHDVAPAGGTAVMEQKQEGDFFSIFYLPSSQSYDEDVHLATSSYVPFQGAASAASAVMGKILSVLDTALAVMNEEFDTMSDSIISESTYEDGLQDRDSLVTSESSLMRCCRETERTSTSASETERASTADEDETSEDSEQSANYESERSAQEKYYFSPQNSLIGNISTLQLFEEGTCDTMKPLIPDQNSMSMNDVLENVRKDESVCKDLTSPDSEIREKEDSEYCIVRNESETNDGWLVVSD
mmetsp:Transcript_10841/g.23957  ORF Transcript_10841/g.23957 Transcript_10841/m.23957 type:complete len:249 (-) Transcript_10841:171-917(-)|eukprot:CAMPEP_0172301948 /NCGR_PEP_ID=MMETSP1058-20130122/3748_1 /TAXON_ID=83371 /ORGANISM="Detonula confervacea, Strain CCMP 353" /LENGTH=248 /DNA_ID=CAMNT_0013012271 /DNA_START=1 /DNA_END=747 /DNA_ORIENTATION=+